MTINELITIAHSDAKAKGFWDSERNTGECLMLIVSECGEALEAHRKGKRADATFLSELEWRAGTKRAPEGTFFEINDKMFINLFEERVKGSFEDRLADIVIRIADFMGSNGWTESSNPQMWYVGEEENVGAHLRIISAMVSDTEHGVEGFPEVATQAILEVLKLAKAHDIDLWRFIELRLAYNRTSKHAKAY